MTVFDVQPFLSPALSFAGAIVFLACAVTDVRNRLIPNALVLVLVALAALRWILAADMQAAALAAAFASLALILGFGLYIARMIGAGDAKLFAAAILWFGAGQTGAYLAAFASLTLLLAVISIMTRKQRIAIRARPDLGALPKAATIPYGVAIGGAAILTLALSQPLA